MVPAGVVDRNRADVVFLINGIPVVIVEAKGINRPDGLALGIEQIRRYHNETPEMFITTQLFGVTQLHDLIGVKVREIHLRQMQRKWASISMKGRLTLNTDLLNLPETLTEYVIVHELVHLLAPNHGKLFKSFMSAYLPDWEERQESLRSFY